MQHVIFAKRQSSSHTSNISSFPSDHLTFTVVHVTIELKVVYLLLKGGSSITSVLPVFVGDPAFAGSEGKAGMKSGFDGVKTSLNQLRRHRAVVLNSTHL